MPKGRVAKQVDTLSPPVVEVVVAEPGDPSDPSKCGEQRRYFQSELSLRQTGELIDFLASLMNDPEEGIDLDELLNTDLSSGQGMANLIRRLLSLGPAALAKVVAILLSAPSEADWIAENITPGEVMRILKTFVQQNDVAGLAQDFFALQAELSTALSQFKPDKK